MCWRLEKNVFPYLNWKDTLCWFSQSSQSNWWTWVFECDRFNMPPFIKDFFFSQNTKLKLEIAIWACMLLFVSFSTWDFVKPWKVMNRFKLETGLPEDLYATTKKQDNLLVTARRRMIKKIIKQVEQVTQRKVGDKYTWRKPQEYFHVVP